MTTSWSDIEDWFEQYESVFTGASQYVIIRAAKTFCMILKANVPDGPALEAALTKVLDALETACEALDHDVEQKKPYVITTEEFNADSGAALAKADDRDVAVVDEDGNRRMYIGTVRLDENRWDVQTFDQDAFDRLKSEIRHDPDLMLSSNLQDTYEHPAYQDLIDAGTDALPYLLRDLQEEPYWWFEAIDEIVGPQNVPDVPDDLKGSLNDLTDLYIEWGRNQGYLHD